MMSTAPADPLEQPWHRLEALPRGTWLLGVVTRVGTAEQRLAHGQRWLQALDIGALPALADNFGDDETVPGLRDIVAELGLPQLCQKTPALAEQLLRTLWWHLERLCELQPRLGRAAAVQQVTAEFREAWRIETSGLDDELKLLMGLGDFAHLQWDQLRGHLRSRHWQQLRQAAEALARMPELDSLIQRLGRRERHPTAPPASPREPSTSHQPPSPMRPIPTRLQGAPGEITGIRWSDRIEHMLGSEAAMLGHPVLKKLWRARRAEGRLLAHDTEAHWVDNRPDPESKRTSKAAPRSPRPLARGPIIVCIDTSGSMQGAPEQIAKAVVVAAMRCARADHRRCLLLAFGGPGELIELELGAGASGLEALMAVMGQSFDGGTDIQTPIERATATVHEAGWQDADLLIVSDGEFGCVPQTLRSLDEARDRLGLRVQGVLVGDRETLGLLEVCDDIHWMRDWRRFGPGVDAAHRHSASSSPFSPVHSKSLTALYFPNALSARAARHRRGPEGGRG